MTTTYTPRRGSKAEQAHMQLTAMGELSTAALADALDVESGALASLLAVPVREGFIVRERRSDGITWWRCGDGTTTADSEDDDPPVHRVIPAAKLIVTEAVKPFRCGIFSDGLVTVQSCEVCVELNAREALALRAFIAANTAMLEALAGEES